MLENGSQFSSAISAFAASPLAAAVTSKVDSVSLSSATEAKVKYDLSAMGTTVASGASGTAVLQNGTWVTFKQATLNSNGKVTIAISATKRQGQELQAVLLATKVHGAATSPPLTVPPPA